MPINSLPQTVLDEHRAFVRSDNPFQQRARLLQALWREREGLPIGAHRAAPLGSRLAISLAQTELPNYLTPAVREVVRSEVEGPKSAGKLYAKTICSPANCSVLTCSLNFSVISIVPAAHFSPWLV